MEIHIRAVENAHRQSRIKKTERKMQLFDNVEPRETLHSELQAYERLLAMIGKAERGEPLEGLNF